ncbi:hypothetical protein D3C74_46450 [compost metagenome]
MDKRRQQRILSFAQETIRLPIIYPVSSSLENKGQRLSNRRVLPFLDFNNFDQISRHKDQEYTSVHDTPTEIRMMNWSGFFSAR